MKWLTLEGIKAQCRIEQDFHEEDDLLVENGEGAEEAILNVCNRTYEELIETYGKVPVSLVHASKMLVDSLYKDRDKATSTGDSAANINVDFPYLLMLASGGHCQILLVHGVGKYELIGQTLDDSAGEAFDKIAKMLGLGYPGGPIVDKRAKLGDAKRFHFPRPLCDKPGCDFSFSGIKTAARMLLDKTSPKDIDEQFINDFCASFQAAVVDCITNRLNNALHNEHVKSASPKTLVVAGGVAKNSAIREAMEKLANKFNMQFAAPPMNLCTDNGAMIAWAGIENYRIGNIVKEPVAPRPRWPLTEL